MRITHHPISDKDVKEAIANMRVIVDSREQKNQHILQFFKNQKLNYETRKLEFGDYSCVIPAKKEWFPNDEPVKPIELSLESRVVIERKGSIDEIATNIGSDRERFERELIRIKAAGAKAVLLLENYETDRVLRGPEMGKYRSNLKPNLIVQNINHLCIRYDLYLVTLASSDYAGLMIRTLLSRMVYEYLKEQ